MRRRRLYNISDKNTRRIRLGWCIFSRFNYILKDRDILHNLKAKVYDQCVIPTIAYRFETYNLTKENLQRLTRTKKPTINKFDLDTSTN